MNRAAMWVVLYALLIAGVSSIPGSALPNPAWMTQDKLLHVVEYAVFGYLLAQALRLRVATAWQLLAVTVLIASTYGGLDEIYQNFIAGRDSSFRDWLADVVGVVVGGSLYLRWKFRRDRAPTG